MKKILFLCTGNSCRSQMAEGYARHLGGGTLEVKSAGIEAHGINPRAIQIMQEVGIDISKQQSTQLTRDMLSWPDMVVTLCGHADESCPVLPKKVDKRHWGLPDPAKAVGSEEQILAQFREVRDDIKRRIETLIASLKSQATEPPATDQEEKRRLKRKETSKDSGQLSSPQKNIKIDPTSSEGTPEVKVGTTSSCCSTEKKLESKDHLPSEEKIKEQIRTTYSAIAKSSLSGKGCSLFSGCSSTAVQGETGYSKQLGYSDTETAEAPAGSNLELGCGNPHAIAALKAGETVLDLGSGGGFDCFLAARKVGSTGHVIGVDMTSEMITKAREQAEKGNYKNVEFRLGEIEALPVADKSVDVIMSNCVVNLSTNKQKVFKEAARVLKPGGRLAIMDTVATQTLPSSVKGNLESYSGCLAGATPVAELKKALQEAGFENVSISVKEESRSFIKGWASESGAENYVASATIEATKPTVAPQSTPPLQKPSETSATPLLFR